MTTVTVTFQIDEKFRQKLADEAEKKTHGNMGFVELVVAKICELADYGKEIPFSRISVRQSLRKEKL